MWLQPSALAADVQLAGLDAAPTHQQLIIKLRQDSGRSADPDALRKVLGDASAVLPLLRDGRPVGLQQLRGLATGAQVVRAEAP